jgi:hypothetical protein
LPFMKRGAEIGAPCRSKERRRVNECSPVSDDLSTVVRN